MFVSNYDPHGEPDYGLTSRKEYLLTAKSISTVAFVPLFKIHLASSLQPGISKEDKVPTSDPTQ